MKIKNRMQLYENQISDNVEWAAWEASSTIVNV